MHNSQTYNQGHVVGGELPRPAGVLFACPRERVFHLVSEGLPWMRSEDGDTHWLVLPSLILLG